MQLSILCQKNLVYNLMRHHVQGDQRCRLHFKQASKFNDYVPDDDGSTKRRCRLSFRDFLSSAFAVLGGLSEVWLKYLQY